MINTLQVIAMQVILDKYEWMVFLNDGDEDEIATREDLSAALQFEQWRDGQRYLSDAGWRVDYPGAATQFNEAWNFAQTLAHNSARLLVETAEYQLKHSQWDNLRTSVAVLEAFTKGKNHVESSNVS